MCRTCPWCFTDFQPVFKLVALGTVEEVLHIRQASQTVLVANMQVPLVTCYLGMFPFTFAPLCNTGRWQPTLQVLYKLTCYVFLQWSVHSSFLPSVRLFAWLEGDSVSCRVCMLHASVVRCLLSTYVGPRPTVHYNIAWLGVLMSYPGHIQGSRWGYHISTHFPKVCNNIRITHHSIVRSLPWSLQFVCLIWLSKLFTYITNGAGTVCKTGLCVCVLELGAITVFR